MLRRKMKMMAPAQIVVININGDGTLLVGSIPAIGGGIHDGIKNCEGLLRTTLCPALDTKMAVKCWGANHHYHPLPRVESHFFTNYFF